MPERWTRLRDLSVDVLESERATLRGRDGSALRISFLEHDLLRIEYLPDGRRRLERTWSVAGADGDVQQRGRERADVARFVRPEAGWRHEPGPEDGAGPTLVGAGDTLAVRVDLGTAALTVRDRAGRIVLADLPGRAWGRGDGGSVAHVLRRDPRDRYYGLGEVSGPLDHHGRRFRLRPKDALGYDARSSDPLYKHLPFYLHRTPDGVWVGLFYDNPTEMTFDFGSEIDNYLGPYRTATASGGDIDLYLIYGPTPAEVLARYAWLTGGAPLPPRWSLGYLASTMLYTEGDDPPTAIGAFADRCQELGIPVDLFHLSSGYTLGEDGRRYVFNWDRRRFPDPPRDLAALRARGLRLAANIKPALLTSHPLFEEARHCLIGTSDGATADGAAVGRGSPAPHTERFWGGDAGHVDFTAPEGYAWWQEQVRSALLEPGIDATWNDNNEYDLEDPDARCQAGPISELRPVQSLLMTRASWEAQRAHRPGERPFVLTRSGMPGSQRYAQTWSGDNRSDWASLRYNVPMGLGLALSGWSNSGHDVGGFAGPAPDPELLVRWVQSGVFHPRFCIHSWNDDGSATEPWMYPEALPAVRYAIRLRYRLLPYLYTLFWRAHDAAEPIHRPLCYAFPDDPAALEESFAFLLGPDLLVPGVFEPGQRRRTLRLPPGDWVDWHDGVRYAGGTDATLPAPLGRPLVLARVGSVVPTGDVPEGIGQDPPAVRRLMAFPPLGPGRAVGELYEDDGVTDAHLRGGSSRLALVAEADHDHVTVDASVVHAGYRLPYDEVEWVLPADEPRALRGDRAVGRVWLDAEGRQHLRTRLG